MSTVRRGVRGARSVVTAERLLIGGAVAAAVYLLAPPVALTLFSALRTPGDRLPFEDGVGWGLDNFAALYRSGALQSTLADTAVFVAGSVVLAFAAALVLAWLVERTDLPLRRLVYVLLLVPLMMPGIVTTMGWVLLFGERTGAMNVAIRTILPLWEVGPIDIFTVYGMVMVQGASLVTLMFVFISAALRGMDPALEDASRTSGATLLATIRGVTLPLLRPHLLAVLILGAILAIESFEVPLLLGLGARADILSTRIYFALNDATGASPDYGAVAVLGLHFMALSFALFFVYHRLTGGAERFATIGSRAQPPALHPLQRWKWPVFAGVAAFLFVVSLAPFLVLVWTSLLDQYRQPSSEAFALLSLDQYAALFADSRLASTLANTAVVVVAAPTLAVGAALVIAWVVVRGKGNPKLRLALDFLASASIAIPAVVAANALLLFYLRLNRWLPDWAPLLGAVVVLVLSYAYRLAVAYRLQRAGIAQLAREMEEAAGTHGASPARTFRDIVVPLVRPSIFGAWVFLAVVAFRELSLPLIIGRDTPPFVVSTLIWKLWGNSTGQAAALGVLSVAFLVAFLLIARWLVTRGGPAPAPPGTAALRRRSGEDTRDSSPGPGGQS